MSLFTPLFINNLVVLKNNYGTKNILSKLYNAN